MAAHVVNGQIDPTAPASLSRATVTDLLRGQLGWDGVVVTDDLGAAAITETFGFEDAIELALNAGNDLLLFANQHDYDPDLAARVIDVVEALVGQGSGRRGANRRGGCSRSAGSSMRSTRAPVDTRGGRLLLLLALSPREC